MLAQLAGAVKLFDFRYICRDQYFDKGGDTRNGTPVPGMACASCNPAWLFALAPDQSIPRKAEKPDESAIRLFI